MRSPIGMRFAHAYHAFGLPIPAEWFTGDPVEQWLLAEAVLTRWHRQVDLGVAEDAEEREAAQLRDAARDVLNRGQGRGG